MASWKKVITSGSAAVLSSLAIDTDLAVAHGGTGASNASTARSNLGLGAAAVLGTAAVSNGASTLATGDQIYDHVTTRLLAVTGSGGDLLASNNLSDLANAGTARTNLGLGTVATTAATAYATAAEGTKADAALPEADVDADLKTLALPANTTISAFAKTFLDDAAASNVRTTLGLGTAATTAASAYATESISAFAATVVDDTSASAMRTTLGLGTAATTAASAYATSTQGTKADNAAAKASNLSDLANAGTARTNLGLGTGAVLDTAAIANGGSGLATADQIHTFVTTQTDAIDANTAGTAAGLSATLAVSSGGTGQTTLAAAAAALLNTNLGGALTIGDANDTVTFGEDVIVTGNLTVNGDTVQQNVTNLNIADKFINLNDGGSAADAGIVFEGQGAALGWDESASRLGFDFAGATQDQTAIAPDAYVSMVVTGSNASYHYNGNIKVASSEIYIYVE